MTAHKQRLTVTVDPELLDAGNQAVATGLADSLSSWVNAALVAKAANDRRLRALAEAIADYEAQFGEITDAEIASQQRTDRGAAAVVRGQPSKPTRASKSPRSSTAPRSSKGPKGSKTQGAA